MTIAPAEVSASTWRPVDTGDTTVAVTQRNALGTTARLAVWPPENAFPAMTAVDDVLSALDLQASRFRPDSEISWLHRAHGGLFMLSDGLAEAVRVALTAAAWTGGRADPTVGAALISLGYDRDFAAIDPDRPGPLTRPVPAPGWQSVRLDGPLLRLPSGVLLDLGATAKGLGSDRAVRAVQAATERTTRGTGGVLVSLGGDIAIGGATLAAEAAALGLIDEYRARVYPLLVGGGIPYFPHRERRVDLELVETRTFSSRVVYLRYRVAR